MIHTEYRGREKKFLLKFLRIYVLGLVLIVISLGLGHKSLASAKHVITVNVPILNVREAPGLNEAILKKVHEGETFTLIKETEYWDEIQLSNQETGWVASWLIKKNKPSSQVGHKDNTAVVKATHLNVRKGPSIDDEIKSILDYGDQVTIHKKKNGWANVSANNIQGWVSNQYITISQNRVDNKSQAHNEEATQLQMTPNNNQLTKNQSASGVAGEQGQWDKIKLRSGKSSYILNWKRANILNEEAKKDGADSIKHFEANRSNSHSQRTQHNTFLKGKTIVIDPGHGGVDDGTTSLNGVHEKSLTLATANLLATKLKQGGATVYLTRSKDEYVSLQKRVDVSNRDHADAFISLHYNASPIHSITGITNFYYQSSKDQELASDIHQAVINATGFIDRGVKFGDLHVLRENHEPSTLIELGFLSNRQEENRVEQKAYQEKAAVGIFNGLLRYFKK